MALAGWQFDGAMPDLPKFVLIVVPHTSNWDFFVGVGALFALGLRLAFLGKDSLFRGPAGPALRWLGGVPVDRSVRHDRVAEMVEVFRNHDRLVVGLTPEGTRKRVMEWKTGFYHVAHGAGVPVVPVAFDYGRKSIIIWDPFFPTGDEDGDIANLRRLFVNVIPMHPANFAP